MKFIRKRLTVGEVSTPSGVLMLSITVSVMDGAMDVARIRANEFHDINFTTGWPTGARKVSAQHPNSGPDSLAEGQNSSHIDSAKLEFLQSDGLESRRSVLRPIFLGDNHEIAKGDIRIFIARCVVLQFLIAPSRSSQIVCPILRIDLLSFKFI